MEWISIKEEKPPIGELIIINDGHKSYHATRLYFDGWEYQITLNFSEDEGCFISDAIREEHIEKWMPLPE